MMQFEGTNKATNQQKVAKGRSVKSDGKGGPGWGRRAWCVAGSGRSQGRVDRRVG